MLKRLFFFVICSSFLCAEVTGSKVGKFYYNNPLVDTTSFHSTQLFSLANINNKTKDISRSGSWRLTHSDQYKPTAISTGSPMFKIKSSTVEIDLNGMEIAYTGTNGDGYIGIEVGFAPSESGTQPTDVVIKNGTIKGFDLGILVHSGVKNIKLENLQIIDSSCGVVLMGKGGDYHSNAVVSCVMNGVRIIGHGANRKTALVNLKDLIEDVANYNYGSNAFMPLRDDAVEAGVDTVHTYAGIMALYARDLFIMNSSVQGIGYNGGDEGTSNRTEGIGVVVRHTTRFGMYNSYVERSASETKAVGLQFEDVNDIEVINCQFNSGTSATKTVGIELFSESAPGSGYLIESAKFADCECNLNYSGDVVLGIDATYARDIVIENVQCNRNNGLKTTYGLYATKLHHADIINSIFSTNISTNASIATAEGVTAAGIYLNGASAGDILAITCDGVQANGNVGTNTGRGCYIKNANAIDISNSSFCLNEGTSLRTSEDTDLIGSTSVVAGHDQSAVVISKHLGVLTQTGGYGIVLDAVTNCVCDNVKASYNQGVRSAGLQIKNSNDCQVFGGQFSSQQATGGCFHSSLASQSPTALAASSSHQTLLYGGDSLSTIDARYATDKFLLNMELVKADQQNSAATEDYDEIRTVISAMSLLQAGVARYRLWGTAVGCHVHNSKACFFKGIHALRNVSEKDSAVGIAFTGEVENCIVRDSELSYNVAWQDSIKTLSAQSYAYTFELQAVHPFWDMLANEAASEGLPSSDGEWERADSSSVKGLDDTTTFVAQGEGLKIRLDGTNRDIANPVGGIAAGCLLGDAAMDMLIEGNVIQGNNGHSGQAYGILMHVAFLPIIRNNRIYYTSTNSYGFSYGLAEISSHATSISLENEIIANKAGPYYNANYLIPFDGTDSQKPGMSYQVVATFNGELDSADVMSDKDSLEVKFSQDTTFYGVELLSDAFLHDDLVARWDEDAGKEWTA